jgi:hypothetical protein
MKSRVIAPIVFLMLLAGFQIEAQAQASASVSFTIVVTEDMLAGGDDVQPRGFGFGNDVGNEVNEASSHVSVSFYADNEINNDNEFQCFETEFSASNTSAFTGMLESQFIDHGSAFQREDMNGDGQYLVVLEYN